MRQTIGVLSLQGDFAKHEEMLQSLNIETVQVRKTDDLQRCDKLIIPGGESTTLTKLMLRYEFYEPIREFSRSCPIMGTCAGLIMLAAEVDDPRVTPLHLIDISVSRNAYGRQIDSFVTDVNVPFSEETGTFRAIFIRAPRIQRIGSDVEILTESQGHPIVVRNKNIFALAFHPELTDDPRIHQYFSEQF